MSLLLESLYTSVIIIDVQPAYDKYCSKVAYRLMEFLNNRTGPVIAFYNGEDMGLDSAHSVGDYYLEHGIDEDIFQDIDFREKTYAFFRNWMDKGMDRNDLIVAIRHMVMKRINDSREISTEEWEEVYGNRWHVVEDIIGYSEDMITLPDISIGELRKYNGCYLCGGGKDECLSEFRLILEAFNIKYKLMKDFIY